MIYVIGVVLIVAGAVLMVFHGHFHTGHH